MRTACANLSKDQRAQGWLALVLDARDGGHASGEVDVEETTVAGLFAHFDGGVVSLQNTAPLTGEAVSRGVSAYTVSTRPHASDYAWVSAAACTSSASLFALACSQGACYGAAGCSSVEGAAGALATPQVRLSELQITSNA